MTRATERIQHVGVAVDFSPHSIAAARVAARLATAHGADLTLIHAREPMAQRHPAAAALMPASIRDQVELGSVEHVRDRLQELADQLDGPSVVWVEIARGIAAEAIVRAALEVAADVLVVGTRGKSQLAAWVVGSVTREITARAHCPVLVIKKSPPDGWDGRFRSIAPAGDGELSAPLLEACRALAADDARLDAHPSSADLLAIDARPRETLDDRLRGTAAERVLRGAEVPVLMLPTSALPEARTAVSGDMGVFAELNGGPCKTYLIASTTGDAMIVDPLLERVDDYLAEVERRGLALRMVVDTHAHAHRRCGGARLAERARAAYIVHESSSTDGECLRVRDGDKLGLGHLEARVLHTPGRADDAMSLLFPDRILTGDFLLGGGDERHRAVLAKLGDLEGRLLVFPGHHREDRGFSTLAEERINNPTFQPRARVSV